MKLVDWKHIVDLGGYTSSPEFARAEDDIRAAVAAVKWPVGSGKFTIFPESGKKRGEGNGVKPIKTGFTEALVKRNWELEKSFKKKVAKKVANVLPPAVTVAAGSTPGAFDCHLTFPNSSTDPFVVEWETGNISSSHRAINRIGLGMKKKYISGGVLVVPTKDLATYLTDRIGNSAELLPYHELWEEWKFSEFGYFAIVTVEHDDTSSSVPRIPKGTDGRAAN